MNGPPEDEQGSPGELAPHADPHHWDELIASLRPEAMLAVISASMSKSLRSQCAPEDIWQETLSHAWRDRAQHRWRDVSAYRAWLFEIARNRIRETVRGLGAEKRGSGRSPQRIADMLPEGSSSALGPADSVTPSRIMVRGERREAVEKALAELPADIREIVRLHLLEEVPMEQIAEQLGLGVSTAWRRFRKGTAICARILPGWTSESSGGA